MDVVIHWGIMGSEMFKYNNNEDDYNSQKKAKDAAFVSYASKLYEHTFNR